MPFISSSLINLLRTFSIIFSDESRDCFSGFLLQGVVLEIEFRGSSIDLHPQPFKIFYIETRSYYIVQDGLACHSPV